MDGIIVVNKPKNFTSRDIVNKVGKILKTKKLGHTGTLDPMATGVLVLCVGKGTKVVEYLTNDSKIYEAEITLGYESITEDLLSGSEAITKEEDVREITESEIDSVLKDLIGKHRQMVPMYSAVKVDGKRLLDYSLSGVHIEERPIKDIEIYDLERTSSVSYPNKKVVFTFRVSASKGTYIRTLCTEIAKRLGTIGAMSELNRIKSGNFILDNASTLEEIERNEFKLYNLKEALSFPEIEADEFLYNKIRFGQRLENRYGDVDYVTFIYQGNVLAVYKRNEENILKADKVF